MTNDQHETTKATFIPLWAPLAAIVGLVLLGHLTRWWVPIVLVVVLVGILASQITCLSFGGPGSD